MRLNKFIFLMIAILLLLLIKSCGYETSTESSSGGSSGGGGDDVVAQTCYCTWAECLVNMDCWEVLYRTGSIGTVAVTNQATGNAVHESLYANTSAAYLRDANVPVADGENFVQAGVVADDGNTGSGAITVNVPLPLVSAHIMNSGYKPLAGLWFGTATSEDTGTVDVVSVVSSDGQLRFIVDSGVCTGSQYKGTITSMSGGDGSGTFTGYAAFGCTFSDGSTIASGPMSFSVSGTTLTGAYSFPGDSVTFSLIYNPVAEASTTLTDLQGNWGYYVAPSWFSDMTISSSGSISGSESSGCTFSGQVSVSDPGYSIVDITLNASGCDDSSTDGSYSGLGLLVSDIGGGQFLFVVSNSRKSGFNVLSRL